MKTKLYKKAREKHKNTHGRMKKDKREAEEMIVLGRGKHLPRPLVCCAKAYNIIYIARERGAVNLFTFGACHPNAFM